MAMTLITTNTHTGDSDTVSTFNSGIDSTYKLYIFKFYDLNPATDNVEFTFQANAVGESGYNETITSTFFRAYHNEADGDTALQYEAGEDQAQGTAYQTLAQDIGGDADQATVGELYLFNPSNTTYVKHFYSQTSASSYQDYEFHMHCAGYFNTTSAIDNIQFKMSSGNFDGTIKMYGVS